MSVRATPLARRLAALRQAKSAPPCGCADGEHAHPMPETKEAA